MNSSTRNSNAVTNQSNCSTACGSHVVLSQGEQSADACTKEQNSDVSQSIQVRVIKNQRQELATYLQEVAIRVAGLDESQRYHLCHPTRNRERPDRPDG